MIFRNNKIFQYYIMTRKLSDWNIFVKKVYTEGKAKNPNYEFKQALEDASKRKSEMKHTSVAASGVRTKTAKKNRNSRKSRGRARSAAVSRSAAASASRAASLAASLAGGRKSRKHRRH